MASSMAQRSRSCLNFAQIPSGPAYQTDVDIYSRPQRVLPIHTGPNVSPVEGYAAANPHRHLTPVSQVEPKTTSQRKRVPVACERCRKRKIKCSGDEGGGRGCINCRNAGWNRCQFLRVQSFNPPTGPHIHSSRHLEANRYHPYSYTSHKPATHSPATQPHISQQSLSYPSWNNGTEYSTYPSDTTPTSSWNRLPFSAGYQLGYGNESVNLYASPPPSYMLPDPVFQPHSSSGYMQSLQRPQVNPLWMEQSHGIAHAHPLAVTMNSLYDVGTSDTRQANMSYGSNISELGRILPDPTTSRGMSFSNTVPTEIPQPMSNDNHQSTISWPSTELASNNSVASSTSSLYSKGASDGSYGHLTSSISSHDFPYSCASHSRVTHRLVVSSNSSETSDTDDQAVPACSPAECSDILENYQVGVVNREHQNTDPSASSYNYANQNNSGRRQPPSARISTESNTFSGPSTCWPVLKSSNNSGNQSTDKDRRATGDGYEPEATSNHKIDVRRLTESPLINVQELY